jgi:hypothetical protein
MDVHGNNPTAEVGEYFRRNIWSWHPLAEFCTTYASEEAAALPQEKWHVNEGEGLDAEHSVRLAKRLRELIADGTVAELVAKWRDPNEAIRGAEAMYRHAPQFFLLLGGGDGHARLAASLAERIERDVPEFADFLECCGGFRIS